MHIHNRHYYSFLTLQHTFKQLLTETVQPHLHWRHVWDGPWKLKQGADVHYHADCIQDTALPHHGLLSDTAPVGSAAHGFCRKRKFRTFHVNYLVNCLFKCILQQNWHWEMKTKLKTTAHCKEPQVRTWSISNYVDRSKIQSLNSNSHGIIINSKHKKRGEKLQCSVGGQTLRKITKNLVRRVIYIYIHSEIHNVAALIVYWRIGVSSTCVGP